MKIGTLREPLITEKTLALAQEENKYIFMVNPLATKAQIKTAVQEAFGVDVEEVHTTMLPGIRKKTGKKRKEKIGSKRKKAVVAVKKGQKIDVFDIQG